MNDEYNIIDINSTETVTEDSVNTETPETNTIEQPLDNSDASDEKSDSGQAVIDHAAADSDFSSTPVTEFNSDSESKPEAQPVESADPYNKYNFYANSMPQGHPAYAYSEQTAQPYAGYQGYPAQQVFSGATPHPGYSASAPQYSGSYQQPGYGSSDFSNSGNTYPNQNEASGYQNPEQTSGYHPQGYQGQNQAYHTQSAGYQNQVYGTTGNMNPGYQNQGNSYSQYQQNPYPAGQISYINNIDSIYPGTAPHRVQQKKEKSGAAKFFTGLAMSVAFGLIAAGVFCLITYFYKQQNPELFSSNTKEVQVTTTQSKNDTRLNLDPAEGTKVPSTSIINGATFTGTDVTDVVEENMPAIVAIDCIVEGYSYWYGNYKASSAGSGIIVNKTERELMIATNYHVVSQTNEIKVKFIDGTTAPAVIKGKDSVADVAVLSISLADLSEDTLKAISVAKLGNSDELKVGEMAIAIGNALGYGQSVTVGYISAKDRDLTIDGQTYTHLLQTDAAINPGNSGGALLNLNGEVIGINNAKISGSDVEGMCYAISISYVQNILSEFISRETLALEEQGYLGIVVSTVTSDFAEMYNWPQGAYISEISEDCAAEKAGLLVGDIITKVDNVDIVTSKDLIEKVQSIRYGTEITMIVQRRVDGEFEEIEAKVVLGKRPITNNSDENTVPSDSNKSSDAGTSSGDTDKTNDDTKNPSSDSEKQIPGSSRRTPPTDKKLPDSGSDDNLDTDAGNNNNQDSPKNDNGSTPGQGYLIPDTDDLFSDLFGGFPDFDGQFPD